MNHESAFPHPEFHVEGFFDQPRRIHEAESGMDLRDYFAGQALVGFLANPELFNQLAEARKTMMTECPGGMPQELDAIEHKGLSMAAYGIADAMMEARQPHSP